MAISESLLGILACIECRGSLEDQGARLVCTKCGTAYPVRDGIPIMLPEEAIKPEAPA